MSTDTDIGGWSTTNDSNATVNGINIAEGCPAANINNAVRAVMGALARAVSGLSDFGGTDTGISNNYVINPASLPSAYFSGYQVWFVASSTNTGVTRLNVTGVTGLLGNKIVYTQGAVPLAGGEIISGALCQCVYLSTLNSGSGGWILVTATLGSQAPISGNLSGVYNDVTASRAVLTNYQNTTGKPIPIAITLTINSLGNVTLATGPNNSLGKTLASFYQPAGTLGTLNAIIMPGQYYGVETESNATLSQWLEAY